MKIHHLRNATHILHIGTHRILVDPMLGAPGTFTNFRWFGQKRQKNPLVPLPPGTQAALDETTACIISHCRRRHLDHLDKTGMEFLRERQIPTYGTEGDVSFLKKKGIAAHPFTEESLGFKIQAIAARHGHGWIGPLVGPGTGWFLAPEGNPSIYLTGDTVLTKDVRRAITELQPDIIIAPAGAAQLDVGQELLFTRSELLELAQIAPKKILFNHLEALDHCPVTRTALRQTLSKAHLLEKCFIPEDGEIIDIQL
ncbi:MBL fold metallo-hydrolase [Desulfobaculum bizertense]|uniref:MBL fold metallo-hydrolase n=1 Tax=Desulfobaculum bizertense TaxID=376490 RepID=UPI001F17B9CB|nr:MBL fold metallo-hydrolase [Desulfobaculum bizertense]UIJ37099.1 MBL fold metallo-hydrolase [Desulfobaculum bizertense]